MNKLKELENKIEELKKRIPSFENGTFLGDYDGLVKFQNELDKLQKKYETDTHILQDQLDLANAKRVEVEKENEELKADLYSANSIINEYIGTFKYFIPNQKVEDKIEELENANWYCESVKNQTIRALKELLEESEKNK